MTDREPAALGPRHSEVKRLRTLLRDPAARAAESAFVLEGPRIVEDALRARRDASTRSSSVRTRGPRSATCSSSPAVDDVPVFDLKEGVLEKLGSTRTPQPVLAVATIPPPPVDRRR